MNKLTNTRNMNHASQAATPGPAAPTLAVDHLVVAAADLGQGVAWCERTLGVTPGPGGQHAFMGTHNRLLRITAPGYARVYFEIIAINPEASPPGRPRWFDLDDPALQAAVAQEPRLVHWVARSDDARATLDAWRRHGVDRGVLQDAQRPLPDGGVLRWRISLREDGQRLMHGALPTVIQWGEVHPADALPDSGLQLQSLTVRGPQPDQLSQCLAAAGAQGVNVATGAEPAAPLQARLSTPRGEVVLQGWQPPA